MKLFHILSFIASLVQLRGSQIPRDLEMACANYAEGKPVILSPEKPVQTLDSVLKNQEHSIIEVLYVLQRITAENRIEAIPQLNELLKFHQKQTFQEKYGDNWRSVKAIDFHAKICVDIKAVIAKLEAIKANAPK